MNAIIVHGGNSFTPYISDCIEQFFIFNKNSTLYFMVDVSFAELDTLKQKFPKLEIVLRKSLKPTLAHRFYLAANRSAHNRWRGGFWRYVVERFFLIQEFMQQTGEANLLHFEYDNLIYADINIYAEKFQALSENTKILLPADGDTRCIAGIMFIPNAESLAKFCKFYNIHCTVRVKNDMLAFSDFIDLCPDFCETLPVVPQSYIAGKTKLVSKKGIEHKKIARLANGFERFSTIFDAAAFGQFVGGIDQRNLNGSAEDTTGFINPDSAYNVQDFQVEWKTDDGLFKPFITFKNESFPLFNLHIHSKKLYFYRSDTYGKDNK
ncbi:MAG: hypothetical protein J6V73_05750 [Spirochaetaceae bacterium]|nr:hypothetical protein [Spirochaetaceae bacterium]